MLRRMVTRVGDKVQWYILGAPMNLLGKHFGEAKSEKEAHSTMDGLLGITSNTQSGSNLHAYAGR